MSKEPRDALHEMNEVLKSAGRRQNVKEVLESAANEQFEQIAIVGADAGGKIFYLYSPMPAASLLYMMSVTKHALLNEMTDEEADDE